jgi:hypothetical protein
MKHSTWIKTVLGFAAMVMLAIITITGPVSPAGATIGGCANGNHAVNLAYNNTWFWNNWNGTQVNGNHVNFNNVHNDGYNDWCKILLGHVSNSGEFPFTVGSGLNARYDGRPFYKFCWQIAQSFCIDWAQYDINVHNGRAIINNSSDNRLLEVVQSSSNYWAPVWSNDLEFGLNGTGPLPVLLGTQNGTIGQGGGLWMNSSTILGRELQFLIIDPAEVCNIHC